MKIIKKNILFLFIFCLFISNNCFLYSMGRNQLLLSQKLMEACDCNNTELARLLIERGAGVNARDKDGYTPLILACWKNNKDLAEYLIGKGADVNAIDKFGYTPLIWACRNNNIDLAILLLEKRAIIIDYISKYEVKYQGKTHKVIDFALVHACRKNNKDWVEYLIRKGADVNATEGEFGYTPLILACENNNIELVNYLIARGADVNASNNEGSTPLNRACSNDNIELAKNLISHGANVNRGTRPQTPLYTACLNNNIELAKYLIDKGAALDAHAQCFGYTPLMLCSCDLNVELAKYLIDKGVDVNAEDYSGLTSLSWVFANFSKYKSKYKDQKELIKFIKLLLKSGAYIDCKDIWGYTPLMIACINHDKEIIALLLSNGANIAIKDRNNKTFKDYVNENPKLDFLKHIFDLKSNKEIIQETDELDKVMLDPFIPLKKRLALIRDLFKHTQKIERLGEKKLLSYVTLMPFTNAELLKNDRLFAFLISQKNINEIKDINGCFLGEALCVYNHKLIPRIFSTNLDLYNPRFNKKLLDLEERKDITPKIKFICDCLYDMQKTKDNRCKAGNRNIINRLIALNYLNKSGLPCEVSGHIVGFVDNFGYKIKLIPKRSMIERSQFGRKRRRIE